jgi:hypothetical protein
MKRIKRNFYDRPILDQRWFLKNTWCDTCQKADIGMYEPEEYEENGTIFIQGKCSRCDALVTSEVESRDV